MNIPNCYYRVSVKALILDNQKRFLLAKEPDGKWDLPGGGLEFGENVQVALKRELKEELGLNLVEVNSRPKYFITFIKANTNIWMANVLYVAKLSSLDFKPSEECIEIQFFDTYQASDIDNYGGVTELIKQYDPKNHNL